MRAKKGVSAVVATVLIIMITVAAIGIIWGAVMPLVRNSIDKSDACFRAQSDVSIDIESGYTCINNTNDVALNDTVFISVEKGADSSVTLQGIQVILDMGGTDESYVVTTGLPDSNEANQISVEYNDSNGDTAEKVSIAPILKVGNTEETCGVAQTVQLTACA